MFGIGCTVDPLMGSLKPRELLDAGFEVFRIPLFIPLHESQVTEGYLEMLREWVDLGRKADKPFHFILTAPPGVRSWTPEFP